LGEERVGARLDVLGSQVRLLHDRRIPGTRANIDHIVISACGVFIVDTKKYRTAPTKSVRGGLFRPATEHLMIGSRDRTELVHGVRKQMELVTSILVREGANRVPIRGALCFVDATWPLCAGAFRVHGVDIVWPKKLARMVTAPGSLRMSEADRIHAALADALPRA
jgi:hypothetical protein